MFAKLFSALFAKIVAVVTWFSSLVVAVFVSLWDIFKDVFSWLFEQILKVAVTALSAIDVSGLAGLKAAAGSIPGEVLQVMGAIGLGEALGYISAALVVRFALQLIPFTRLGS